MKKFLLLFLLPVLAFGQVYTNRLKDKPLAAAPASDDKVYIDGSAGTRALDWRFFEPALGNPVANGYVLSGSTLGTRTWIPFPAVLVTSVAGRIGAVVLTKTDITGIDQVDNTSDEDKPISTAVQDALDLKADLADLGTAAAKNVAASGNAASGEVVQGSDTRLSDSRTPTTHTHPAAQIADASAVGRAFLTTASPAAVRFPRLNADNTVSYLDAATFSAALGVGAGDVTLGGANAFTGANSFAGVTTFTGAIAGSYTAMPALDVNFAKWGNSYNVTGDASLTFNGGTPPPDGRGTWIRLVNASGTNYTITFATAPWSSGIGDYLSSVVVNNGDRKELYVVRRGSEYEVKGDPFLRSGVGKVLMDQGGVASLYTFTDVTHTQKIIASLHTLVEPTSIANTALQLVGYDATATYLQFDTVNAAGAIFFRNTGGTMLSKTATASGASLGWVGGGGYTGSAYHATPSGKSEFLTTQTQSAVNRGTKWVLSVTPNNSTTLTDAITVDQDGSVTMSGKLTARSKARVLSITSSGTPAINTDLYDAVKITAQAAAITSMTTSLTGTPDPFDMLVIRIKDDGTARAISWGASFASRGATLPTTTVLSKVLYVLLIWNADASTWDCVSTAQES